MPPRAPPRDTTGVIPHKLIHLPHPPQGLPRGIILPLGAGVHALQGGMGGREVGRQAQWGCQAL